MLFLAHFLQKLIYLPSFFKNTLYETNQSNYLYFHTDNNDNIKMLIQNIVREANTDDNYSSTCCNGYVQILFSTLLRKYGKSALYYGFNEQDSIDTDFTFILEYITQHYRTVTLDELSEFSHYSKPYLSSLFKKNMNQTFVNVLRNIKMRHALDFLANTEKQLKKLESKSDIIQPITLVVLSNNIIIVARLNSGKKSESNREDCL